MKKINFLKGMLVVAILFTNVKCVWCRFAYRIFTME